jgi:putative hydrolase of the HAD superfamily
VPIATRQNLIFDADDTLWENNVIFERVVDDYIAWLAHPTLDRSEIRTILADIEEANIVTHGYGSQVFLRSLTDCFTHLMQRPVGLVERARFDDFAAAFTSGKIELLPAVEDVLAELATRHDLYLMTKGARDEQERKIEASGLADRFLGVDIVPTKQPETYCRIVAERGLEAGRTWMIGNSPKSDVLAARAAGLRAVFVPHPNTWEHEHAELDPSDDGILEVRSLAELLHHF